MKSLPTIVIVMLITVSAILGYGIYKQKVSKIPITNQTLNPTQTTTESSCDQFAPTQGEITCEQAMNIALEKYKGEVFSAKPIDRYLTKEGKQNVWLISVDTKSSLLKIIINRVSGNILSSNSTTR